MPVFDLPDKTKVEVPFHSQLFSSDCCPCRFIVNADFEWVSM